MKKKSGKQTIRNRNASGKPKKPKKIVLFGHVLSKGKFDRKKLRILSACVLALFLLLFIVLFQLFDSRGQDALPPTGEAEVRIHFVDVGQGDCAMIEFPDGKTAVIDGGDSDRKDDVDEYARQLQIEKIDYLIVSHGDADHCGGLITLLDRVEIGAAYLPYEGAAVGKVYQSVYKTIAAKATSVQESRRYEQIVGEGYSLTFLYPYGKELMAENKSANNTSAVVWLDYYGTNALFCGDIEKKTEKQLVAEWEVDAEGLFLEHGVQLDSTEILKVAHHGSKTSSSEEWLRLLNYETAVISCGAGNRYGHPNDEVVERLVSSGNRAQIYRTDEEGNIVATLRQNGTYEIDCEKQAKSEESDNAVRSVSVAEWFGSVYVSKNRYAEEGA